MTTIYNAPHEVKDTDKFNAMVEAIRTGQQLPSVVVLGYDAYTGSHRLAAYSEARRRAENLEEGWEDADTETPIIEIEDEEYIAACERIFIEPGDEIYDYNEFCEALYEVTAREELKFALEDQRG